MRALVAALLASVLLSAAPAPHVHTGQGDDDCAVCVLRHTELSWSEAPDVSPPVLEAGEVDSAPGLPPVTGAPLGAIPGQSPPA